MLQPTLTAEQLESANDDLRMEQEFTSLESYIDKYDGMMMMGRALNAMPKLSIESAALTEVASAILTRGTDLSGVDDFVPGIESMALQGLEAEGTGQGFLDKAKKVGAAIIEKIKKLVAWILEKVKLLGLTKAKKVKDVIDELGLKLEKADKESTVTVPKYVADLIESGISNELRTYLKDDPFKQFNGTEIYESLDNWKGYIDQIVKNLATLSSAPNSNVTEGFVLDKIPSGRTLSFKMSPDLVKITMKPVELLVSDQGTVDIKVSKIMDGISTMQKDIWYLFNFVSMNTRGMDKFNSGLSHLFSVVNDPRLLGAHMVLLRVIAVEIPTLALDGFQHVSNVTATLKTEKQKGASYPS